MLGKLCNEKKRRTEDETAAWHTTAHVSGHEFKQTHGYEGQEGWAAAVHMGCRADKSERPNNNWLFRCRFFCELPLHCCCFYLFPLKYLSFFFPFAGLLYVLYIHALCLMYVLQSLFLFHVSCIFLVSFHDEIKFWIPITLKLINISFSE